MKSYFTPKRLTIIGYIVIPLLLILFLIKDKFLTVKTVTYQNNEYQFEIPYPLDWKVEEKVGKQYDFFCELSAVTLTSPSQPTTRTIDVNIYQQGKNCPPASLESYLDKAIRQIVMIQTGKEVDPLEKLSCTPNININQSQITCKEIQLGQENAYKLVFNNDKERKLVQHYLVEKGDNIYLLTYRVDPMKAINVSKKDTKIINSFHFQKPSI